MDAGYRPLTPAEKRFLALAIASCRRQRGRVPRHAGSACIFLLVALVSLVALTSDVHWYVAAAILLPVTAVIAVWSSIEVLGQIARIERRYEDALRADLASEVGVTATAVVELEEFEDEGGCYAFQTGDNEITFIQGQSFGRTVRFPSADFALVKIFDGQRQVAAEFIRNKSKRLDPVRVIPASFLRQLPKSPAHLERASGTLDQLESILRARTRAQAG